MAQKIMAKKRSVLLPFSMAAIGLVSTLMAGAVTFVAHETGSQNPQPEVKKATETFVTVLSAFTASSALTTLYLGGVGVGRIRDRVGARRERNSAERDASPQ